MNRAPLSLKAQALSLLARREYSRAELRQKLLGHARKRAQWSSAAENKFQLAANPLDGHEAPTPAEPSDAQFDAAFDAEAAGREVDEVLDSLEAARHQSDARFAESRVHARAPRQGLSRIRQELKRHGVELDADAAQKLRETEFERARTVWRRKYGDTPSTEAADRSRQMRFLASRGFASDVIRRVVGGREDD